MNNSVRVFELAKRMGVSTDDLLAIMRDFGFVRRTWLSTIDAESVDKITEYIRKRRDSGPGDFDKTFESRVPKKPYPGSDDTSMQKPLPEGKTDE